MNAINMNEKIITISSVFQLKELIEGREGISYLVGDTYMALTQSPYQRWGEKTCILEGAIITIQGKDYRQISIPMDGKPITAHQWVHEGARYHASATFERV